MRTPLDGVLERGHRRRRPKQCDLDVGYACDLVGGKVDAGIANFREAVVPFARGEGSGAILLVDRQTGKAIAITLWETEEALKASDERANALRADAAQEMGAAQAPNVERYEVAVFEI